MAEQAEPFDRTEFEGLVRSARVRLNDAGIDALSPESRFDLAYNAFHALALATLRRHGYRSENRFIVFQCLQHTVRFGPEVWRIFSLCHNRRNRAEYEGQVDISKQLVDDLMQAARQLQEKVAAMEPAP